ncbi:carboxypeptidase-like regulatory domain-containing protein [Pontibacter aquaedesilientis]|uniref:carboxypeptidase-like regulatory domain-containing protein n=1 Tax=Pontibacter aquaedesilientis TaxID=2766980 RepID=UPI001CD139E6|nr:carboxypeptidase-like regulatory domain-containing protein [Pontibacter aquaedesilientis]
MLKNKRAAGWLLPLVVLAFILLGTTGEVAAQGHKRVVQLTGFVTIGDSLYGVAGVNVYVPKTSRGAQTNAYGFFSVPVLTGDSVVFSAIGYKKQYLKVPKNYQSQSYSIIMQMQEDPTQLPEVQVFPWATERDFRDAVLAVKVPDDGMAIAMRNLDPKRLEELFSVTPMDGNANFRNWNMQNVQRQEQRNMFPTVSPFAIIQLLNMLKNGEFNKK